MKELTKEDWVEIYYALVDKQAKIDEGTHTNDDDVLADMDKEGVSGWSAHLGHIIDQIGPDGENMTEEERLPENIQKYVEGGGDHCPFCGRDTLSGGDRDMDGGIMSQEVTCESCGKEWQDLYKLYDIYVDDPGKFPLRLG